MGDTPSGPARLSFNPQLRVEFRGATVTSDAGLLLPRELDERLGLSTLIDRYVTDPRTGHNRQFPLPDLFRQSIYSRLAGYEDTNDAERLAEDPAFRMLASRERRETRTYSKTWEEPGEPATLEPWHGDSSRRPSGNTFARCSRQSSPAGRE
ncbi:MAG: transposase, partial [Candidatus Rokubacteria bacterium]|nr:transposase [Candidatus Rokubacteria bacterium]